MADATGEAESKPTRSLLPIPLEILQEIATHLDRKSAYALTLSCKGLRDAGETKLYETADLTAEYTAETNSYATGELVTDDEAMRCQKIVSKRCDDLKTALDAYPYRLECIRTLRVQVSNYRFPTDMAGRSPCGEITVPLFGMIARVSPYVRDIYISTLSTRVETSSDTDPMMNRHEVSTGYELFKLLSHMWGDHPDIPNRPEGTRPAWMTYPKLRVLDLQLPVMAHDTIPALIAQFTNDSDSLRELGLAAAAGRWASKGYQGQDDAEEWRNLTKYLHHLRRLHIRDPHARSVIDVHLDEILKRAVNLEEISFSGERLSASELKALPHFAKMEKLKRVEVLTVLNPSSGKSLRVMTEHASDLVVRESDLDELDELDPLISKTQNTRRMTLLTTNRPSRAEYAEAGVLRRTMAEHDALPVNTRLGAMLFENNQNMPVIDTIMFYHDDLLNKPFPTLVGHSHNFSVPPDRWEKEGHCGFIIRTYRHAVDIRRTFDHIRCLSRLYHSGNEDEYIGFKRHWRENARYRQNFVPMAIVAKMYEAANIERAWLDPGRDFSLNDAAWAILDEWHSTLPPDEADAVSIADVESEEGDWEDEDDGSMESMDIYDLDEDFYDHDYDDYDSDDPYNLDAHGGW